MGVLSNLEPKKVFEVFEMICGIPHGSGNRKPISDFCVNYAKERGLKVVQDEAYNVIIYKEASKGYEAAKPVILQGHLDMVCEQDASISSIDMATQGLELAVDGDEIHAKGTTLGGDNGIAVAYCLALLDDETIKHPKLEILLTVDEEVGMLGAEALDGSLLSGRTLINLDSEEEGTFLSSCAGGIRCQCFVPVEKEMQTATVVSVRVHGLNGGHSGMEIVKQRGNSNVLMARALNKVNAETPIHLITMEGGLKDNAIPLDTTATIVTANSDKVVEVLKQVETEYQKELSSTDKDVRISIEVLGEKSVTALTQEATKKVLTTALCLPNGIQRMSSDIEGLVQTSLNMGILKLQEDNCLLSYSIRSSVETEKYAVLDKLIALTELVGGTYQTHGDYPGWQYEKNSRIRTIALEAYKKLYQEEAKVEAIHAGLECGLLAGKLPGLDAISFGPNMKDVHTSKERLSISSSLRIYKLLVEILANCVDHK